MSSSSRRMDDGTGQTRDDNMADDGDVDAAPEVLSSMDVDRVDPPFRILERVPTLTSSPTVYLCCGAEDSATLKEYILATCEEHSSRAGLRSVHRDPLSILGTEHAGFVLRFVSSEQSALVRSMLSLPGWTNIPEAFATDIISVATDAWVLKAPTISPIASNGLSCNLPTAPSLPLPSSLSASTSLLFSSSLVHHPWPAQGSTPSLPASSASGSLPSSSSYARRPLLDRVSIRRSPCPSAADRRADSSSTPTSSSGLSGRRRRGTAKKNRGGCRHALFQKFGLGFWEFLKVMTPDQFAECTPEQQAYITKHMSLESAKRQAMDSDDRHL
jgi:hypothetical protein